MERRIADILNKATSHLYQEQAVSFSQTRQSAWPGWERVLPCFDELLGGGMSAASSVGCHGTLSTHGAQGHLRLLDLACGNLRFEQFLERERPSVDWDFVAVDGCEPLVGQGANKLVSTVAFEPINLVQAALEDEPTLGLGRWLMADACACFGFMHHVPGEATRQQVLRALVNHVRPGGIVTVSLWQFMKSESLARQAAELRLQALADLDLKDTDLEPGDHLLGWRNVPGLYRYCHSFDEAEADRLVAAVANVAQPIAAFESDGRTGNLNRYLVLRRS